MQYSKIALTLLLFAAIARTELTQSDCVISGLHINLGDNYYSSESDIQIPSKELNNNDVYVVWNAPSEECDYTVKAEKYDKDGSELKDYSTSPAFTWKYVYDFTQEKDSQVGTYSSTAYTALLPPSPAKNEKYTYTITDNKFSDNTVGPYEFFLTTQQDSNKKILILGDIDLTTSSYKNIDRFESLRNNHFMEYAGIIQMGDIAYNLNSNLGQQGDDFFNAIQEFAQSWPFVMTPGNHEYYDHWNFLNFRFRNPLFNASNNQYFSINWQGIHFLFVNYDYYENTTSENATTMYDWIKADLEQANSESMREKYPFIVVISHKPIYCLINVIEEPEYKRCYTFYEVRKQWDKLYTDNQVDLVLQAHMHDYERMDSISKNQTVQSPSDDGKGFKSIYQDPGAPVYIIEGVGGHDLQPNYNFDVSYGVKQDGAAGYGTLEISEDDDTRFLNYTHYESTTFKVVDYLTIRRPRSQGTPFYIYIIIGASVALVAVLVFIGHKQRKHMKDIKAPAKEIQMEDGSYVENYSNRSTQAQVKTDGEL